MKKIKSEYGIKGWNFLKVERGFSTIIDAKFPDVFNLGKNRFTLNISPNKLLKGSDIFIDILDSLGKPIYYEISGVVNDDNTRNIVVYIYDDTPIGIAKIYIAGTLKGSDTELVNTSNYLATFEVGVNPTIEVIEKVVLKNTPVVTFKEKLQPVAISTGVSRLTEIRTSSGSFSTIGGIIPMQFIPDTFNVETRATDSSISTNPSVNGDSATNDDVIIPSYTNFSILTAKNFYFSSSMKGGKIELNDINVNLPADITYNEPIFYTASIVEVINSSSIKVYPPFSKTITQTFSADRFFNQTNFTCSFYQYQSVSQSATTQSFATFDISGLEPEFGVLSSIDVSYKPVNSFGEFRNIGSFKLSRTNLFTDPNATLFDAERGLIEKPIGNFRNVAIRGNDFNDFQRYWIVGGSGSAEIDNGNLSDSVRVSGSGEFYIVPRVQYGITSSANTSYTLEFNSKNTGTGKLDIYITGSSPIVVLGERPKTDTIQTNYTNVGTYIGTVEARNGSLSENAFEFKTKDVGTFRPLVLVTTGSWNISDMSIYPIHQPGFNSNQTRVQIPLTDVETKSELFIKVQYKNSVGELANKENLLKGVVFQGNKPEVVYHSESIMRDDFGYKVNQIRTSTIQFNNIGTSGGGGGTIRFPIFRATNFDIYTGSFFNAAIAYTVHTTIFGKTGSYSTPTDTYNWAFTQQGRAIVSRFDNNGRPLIFNTVSLSGSSVNAIGTFGNGPTSKTNLDSWLTIGKASIADEFLRVNYNITSTSSFNWDANVVSHCEAIIYESRY